MNRAVVSLCCLVTAAALAPAREARRDIAGAGFGTHLPSLLDRVAFGPGERVAVPA